MTYRKGHIILQCMKNIFKITFCIILLSVAILYTGIVFLLPQIINNKMTINKLQSLIHSKTGIETNITALNLKISPTLLLVLNIESIDGINNHNTVLDIKKVSVNYKLLKNELILINAKKIYVDGNYLKQLKKSPNKNKKNNFELGKLPEINIQNLTYKSDKISIYAKSIESINNCIKIKADIKTPYLKETIILGDSGNLQAAENGLKADKFKIKLGNSNLYVDGILIDKNKSTDFNINGEKLSVSEIMPMLLHFQKSQDSSKKFIENFKNFNGTVNVNLKINKEGIWGKCIANNLSANAVWFNIPLYFKEAVFNFRGRTVDSVAEGILGKEKVVHTLDVTKMGTPEKEVIGTMKTTLTKKFDYVPNLTVLNSVNFSLIYKIKNKKPDVYYNIDIPANSDLIYNSFYLGLRNYNRKISANTLKDDNDLYLKEYKYSYSDSKKENIVVSGNGLFKKNVDKNNPDKFIPQYITCNTNGYAPISVTGSFGEKVKGGEFKGDLKYDFKNNQVLGTFDIVHARHKAFHINQAHVESKNGIFNVTSDGFFKGEKYLAELSLKNNIYGDTLIYNMKMFLDKLIFETTPETQQNKTQIDPNEITKKVTDSPMTINNWEIAVNEIRRDKFLLQNVNLLGSMKNNVFDFKMRDLKFADGIIHAKGIYDFNSNASRMNFEAQNINSNKVAEMTLNLQNQIEGIANAKLDLNAKDMFKYLDAHCNFEIKEGFLPKLGDTEFAFNDSKYKLSEITNLDLTKKDLMKDDIKGTFDVHNTELKNINITTWHEVSAMYLEGNYEMEKQLADLQLFWKYSKEAPKGIRIFCVPLSLILKVVFRPENSREIYQSQLSKVPKIKADSKNTLYYRMKLKGDINKNKIDLTFKEIR